MLKLINLNKDYNSASSTLSVIHGLNYEFPQSASIAIVGRSGIGKSTLLHILGCLDKPTSGQIIIDGQEVSGLNADELARVRAEKIGFVFQFHHLLPEFSALENVAMPLFIAGIAEAKALQQASAALKRVDLGTRLEHRPGELSGGEQQRVAVARAIATRPRIILADEPTGNLDEKTAASLQNLLLEIQREQKSLLIVVTHSKELAAAMDFRLEMLPGGALQAIG